VKDPYLVLGVARDASADEIKQAYRALARELHPDVNQGNRRSEDRFKEVSAAYDFLSDSAKRAQFDNGEIDATGAVRRRARPDPRWGNPGRGAQSGFGFGDNADDILSELMRRRDKGRAWSAGTGQPQQGQDSRHKLTVSFVEAALGATRRVTLVTGKSLDVRIPPGSVDGQALRLKGQGHPGTLAADGDAYIDIAVEPHPYFSRRELDVLVEVPVSLQEAVLGGKVTVPTVDGKVSLSIPAGSNTGSVLRLKGKGIAGPHGRGDQMVTLKVVLPDNDAELKKFVEKWGPKHDYDPRVKAGM